MLFLLFYLIHKEFCTLLYLGQEGIKFYRLCLYEYFLGGLETLQLSFEMFIYNINFYQRKKE